MQTRFTSFALLALAVILAGCKQAPPPPAPDTHDADVKAIHDLEAAAVQAFAARDVDKVAAFYADDASVFNPDSPVINGTAAIKAWAKSIFEDKNFSLIWASTKGEVSKSGDLAYAQGIVTSTWTDPKTKKVLTLKGKYVTVYKKQSDGGWKVVACIYNEDAPAAPAK